MADEHPELARLRARLGYKKLNRTWAKLEILLGLTAAGVGLMLSNWALSPPLTEFAGSIVAAALALFVLGGYLALAGHRSHLYQSSSELTAYTIETIRGHKEAPDV